MKTRHKDKNLLLNDLRRYYSTYKLVPTYALLKKDKNFSSPHTYARAFGGFTKALIAAGLVTEKQRINLACAKCNNTIITKAKKYCSLKCSSESKKRGVCIKCAAIMTSSRKVCSYCREKQMPKTLKDLKSKKTSDYHSRIRNDARGKVKNRLKICAKCSYDKFVEVCHIKPIKDFDETAKILVVNADSNLLLLCPNCHWELDHRLWLH